MNDHDLDRLQRFFDGALPADEARAVSERVDRDADWSAAHDALKLARGALREQAEVAADAADFGGLWRNLDRELFAPAVASPAVADVPTLGDRLRAWWAAHWTPVLVSAAAAAIVAVLMTRTLGPGSPPPEPGQPAPSGPPIAHQQPAPVPAPSAAEKNVVVDAVRNEGNKTVLINMPMAAEDATVIWLLDDEHADEEPVLGEDPI